MKTPFKTTTPSAPAMKTKQALGMQNMQNTSWSGPPAHCAHFHKPPKQVLKSGDSFALRKVQHPHNGRTSVNRLPLMKQDILSHYSSCFEGIGHFREVPYKFHLNLNTSLEDMLQQKFQSIWKMHSRKRQVFGEIRHSRRGERTH